MRRGYAPLADWPHGTSLPLPAAAVGCWGGEAGRVVAREPVARGGGSRRERGPRRERSPQGGSLQRRGGSPRKEGVPRRRESPRRTGSPWRRGSPRRKGSPRERGFPKGSLQQKGVPREDGFPRWDGLRGEEVPREGGLLWRTAPEEKGVPKMGFRREEVPRGFAGGRGTQGKRVPMGRRLPSGRGPVEQGAAGPQAPHPGVLLTPWLALLPAEARTWTWCPLLLGHPRGETLQPPLIPSGVPSFGLIAKKRLAVNGEQALLERGCSSPCSPLAGRLHLHLHVRSSGRNERGELGEPSSASLTLRRARSCPGRFRL